MRSIMLAMAFLLLAACEPASGNQGLSEVQADGLILEVADPDGSGPEGPQPEAMSPEGSEGLFEGSPEVAEPGETAETTEVTEVVTPPFLSAEPWPAMAVTTPRLRLVLAGVDNAARTVSVEVVLEGDLELSGLAFSLPFDASFLKDAQATPSGVLTSNWEAKPALLSAIRPGSPAMVEHGEALLRVSQLSPVDVYYMKGPLELPTDSLSGSHVLSRLTFHVPGAGTADLVFPETGAIAKDAGVQAIPLARQGLRLTAQ